MKAEILLIQQLKNNFLLEKEEETIICSANLLREAENKTLAALTQFRDKYLNGFVDPFNSVMYCNYLYWVSRLLYCKGAVRIADKVYYLNKMMNSVELFYEVKLPDIWSCAHPLGSVMGKADYGDYFYFYQGCTVGGNFKKDGTIIYPKIGKYVKMFSNSKILGNSKIGDNVIISANCYIKNQDVPNDTIVFGQSPALIFKDNNFVWHGAG